MRKYALLTALFLLIPVKSFAAPYDHIHLAATSTQEAVNWYVKHFGGEAARFLRSNNTDYPIDRVMYGDIAVIFFERDPGEGSVGSGVDHFGFSMSNVADIEIVKNLDLIKGDVVASVGGDGTFCEVITGFMLRNDNAYETFPLALIPAGTGNSQANDMGIEDYRVAISKIINGNLKKVDIGETKFVLDGNEEIRYSHNLVGWGLGVDSNILAEKMRFLGPLRYDVGVLLSILRGKIREAKCYIDGHLINSSFILL